MTISFSINQYDKDGDMIDECILLHIYDDNITLRFETVVKLQDFARYIERIIIPSIEEVIEIAKEKKDD